MLIAQVAATYIGTVVGSGFATGQEILQFFTIHYMWGTIGIIFSTLLFIWLGTKMMLFSNQLGAYSYQQLNQALFGKYLGSFINLIVFIVLFGTTAVMLSGTGAIFQEQLGLSYQLGIIVTILLSFLVIIKGLKGIFVVNSLVVPTMLLFSLLVLFHISNNALFKEVFKITPFFADGLNLESWKWLTGALTYVAFNLTMAQAVLVPMGKEICDRKILRWGGIFGGLGLGFMLLIGHLGIFTMMPGAMALEIPMAHVIKQFGLITLGLFLLVVYGEVFTTLIGNVFGLTRQIQSMIDLPEKWLIIMILLVSFVISQIGFSSLVQLLYPIFGLLGMVLLLFIAIKKVT